MNQTFIKFLLSIAATFLVQSVQLLTYAADHGRQKGKGPARRGVMSITPSERFQWFLGNLPSQFLQDSEDVDEEDCGKEASELCEREWERDSSDLSGSQDLHGFEEDFYAADAERQAGVGPSNFRRTHRCADLCVEAEEAHLEVEPSLAALYLGSASQPNLEYADGWDLSGADTVDGSLEHKRTLALVARSNIKNIAKKELEDLVLVAANNGVNSPPRCLQCQSPLEYEDEWESFAKNGRPTGRLVIFKTCRHRRIRAHPHPGNPPTWQEMPHIFHRHCAERLVELEPRVCKECPFCRFINKVGFGSKPRGEPRISGYMPDFLGGKFRRLRHGEKNAHLQVTSCPNLASDVVPGYPIVSGKVIPGARRFIGRPPRTRNSPADLWEDGQRPARRIAIVRDNWTGNNSGRAAHRRANDYSTSAQNSGGGCSGRGVCRFLCCCSCFGWLIDRCRDCFGRQSSVERQEETAAQTEPQPPGVS